MMALPSRNSAHCCMVSVARIDYLSLCIEHEFVGLPSAIWLEDEPEFDAGVG